MDIKQKIILIIDKEIEEVEKRFVKGCDFLKKNAKEEGADFEDFNTVYYYEKLFENLWDMVYKTQVLLLEELKEIVFTGKNKFIGNSEADRKWAEETHKYYANSLSNILLSHTSLVTEEREKVEELFDINKMPVE